MDVFDEELVEFWRSLIKNKVQFIMVGGIATNLHGFSRTTADVDLWIKDNKTNRFNLLLALKEIGLDYLNDLENYQFIPGWASFRTVSGIELDIMTYLKDFPQEQFELCLSLASSAKIFELEIPFLHINHLIDEKKATNRNKDKIDVEELEKIKLLRENR
ncbi:MAG: hypothetical protein V4683_14470 [Bacteroidota bacterium]